MRIAHQDQTGPMMEQVTHKIVEGTPRVCTTNTHYNDSK